MCIAHHPLLFIATLLTICCTFGRPVSAAEPCSPNSDVQINLGLLKTGSDKDRAVAAGALIKDWRTSLPTVMGELKNVSGPADRWTPDQQSYILSVSDIIRTTLSNNTEAITLFRSCDDASIARPLIWAARGQNQSLRLNSTLILGNVVDNTTVCFVLHHLADPDLSANGRANLLGVTLAMASYAYQENADSIERTLGTLKPRIEPSMAQTQKLISDISVRTKASQNRTKSLAQANLGEPCAHYEYDRSLDR